jgi:hypothetical protein
VQVQRVLALEVEGRTGHFEEGKAGAIVHLEEGMERPAFVADRDPTPAQIGSPNQRLISYAGGVPNSTLIHTKMLSKVRFLLV